MKKKENFIEGLKIITLGLLLGLGIGMIQASNWNPPTSTVGTYSPNNVYPPLNVGTEHQLKPAGSPGEPYYHPITSTKHGGLSVDSLSVLAGTKFDGSVSVGNSLVSYGDKKIAKNLIVSTLANSTEKEVCTDADGKLVVSCLPIPINGACGLGNGAVGSSLMYIQTPYCFIPEENEPVVSGGTSGPWNWECPGLNGGTTAHCSASKIPSN